MTRHPLDPAAQHDAAATLGRMGIRPVHHALLSYAEWCCDNRRPWPKWTAIAADLARNERELRVAFGHLERLGLVSVRSSGHRHMRVLRLGDGRETAPAPYGLRLVETPVIHSRERSKDVPSARRKAA